MASFEEILEGVEAAAAGASPESTIKTDTITGHLDVEQLKGMKMADLKALANDLGLKYAFNIKKEALIEMIAAASAETERAAIMEGKGPNATEAAPGLIEEEEQDTAPAIIPAADELKEGAGEEDVEQLNGRVLVTYTGMVNLRDENLDVVDQAIQGQTFRVTGKCKKNGTTWYRVEDRQGKQRLISADVVRYMA